MPAFRKMIRLLEVGDKSMRLTRRDHVFVLAFALIGLLFFDYRDA
jgi:hypothetical protein